MTDLGGRLVASRRPRTGAERWSAQPCENQSFDRTRYCSANRHGVLHGWADEGSRDAAVMLPKMTGLNSENNVLRSSITPARVIDFGIHLSALPLMRDSDRAHRCNVSRGCRTILRRTTQPGRGSPPRSGGGRRSGRCSRTWLVVPAYRGASPCLSDRTPASGVS